MKDHYKTLGLKPNAKKEEIKKAYFELAKKYHPDSSDKAEVQKFHEITEAYKTLTDDKKRKEYDLELGIGEEKPIKKPVGEKEVKKSSKPQKRAKYRDVELKLFHQNRFKKAVLRVVGFSIFFAIVGGFLGLVLGGAFIGGVVVGMLMGLEISLQKNFDVQSFFRSKEKQIAFNWLLKIIYFGGILYFFLLFWFVTLN